MNNATGSPPPKPPGLKSPGSPTGSPLAGKLPRAGGLLSLSVVEKSALYSSYMPYVKNGGIFIPTVKEYSIGQEIFLLLQLPDSTEKIPIAGKIIWITPAASASVTSRPGIGVQFSDKDQGATQKRIEVILGGSLNAERPTRTM